MRDVVVVGAGIGGLTVAALLARAGVRVTVLEAHVYPGGCAGTFFHRGYRFDAGATLAGGFAPGAPMERLAAALSLRWPAERADPAMVVHLPDGAPVVRWCDASHWQAERLAAFGEGAEPFWRWQERTADVLWPLAQALPPWPPQTARDLARLGAAGVSHLHRGLPRLAPDLGRAVSARLPAGAPRLRRFVDAQLLIAAQATSDRVAALYGAAALDLPRRGVVHLAGGMGAIAETLAEAVRRHGGAVRLRQQVSRIAVERGRPCAVETRRGDSFAADTVVINLPPANAAALLGDATPPRLRRTVDAAPWPADGWGAFVLYLGVDGAAVPAGFPLHHQIVVREPLAEGNSVFLSLSPPDDPTRAPAGCRAATLSTHTAPREWWALYHADRPAYEARVAAYRDRLLRAAERAVPGLGDGLRLVLPGTPVTFQRFTRRLGGWVGGYPQTSLFRTLGPRLGPGLWLVGDSIFPGQSTAAAALGGARVARLLLGG